jgi:hypothetical protein
MCDAKAPKTGDAGSKKPEAKAPAPKTPEAGPSATPAEASSAGTSSGKADPAPKSASQLSISHFSSVSTPAYRSGWDAIFGGGKTTGKARAKTGNGHAVPDRIELDDEDIDPVLIMALYKAFQRQALMHGVILAQIRKTAAIEYILICNISGN